MWYSSRATETPPWVLYINFWLFYLSLSPYLDSRLRYNVRPFPPNLTIFTHCAIIKGRHLFQTRQILHGVRRSLQGWLWEEGIRLHLVSQERLQLPGTVDRLGQVFPHSKHHLIWRAVHWWMRNPWPKVRFSTSREAAWSCRTVGRKRKKRVMDFSSW